jgi:hypothetical protein
MFDDDVTHSEFKLPPLLNGAPAQADTPKQLELFSSQRKRPAEGNVTAPIASAEPKNDHTVVTKDQTPLAEKLEITCDQAIDKIAEIMKLPLDPRNEGFAATLRAQSSVSTQTLSAQIRVDTTKLQYAQRDRMPEILRQVAEVEAKLPPFKPTGGDWGHPETTKRKTE